MGVPGRLRNADLSMVAVAAPSPPCCGVRDDRAKVHRDVDQVSKLMRSLGAELRGCVTRYTCDGECEPYAYGDMSWQRKTPVQERRESKQRRLMAFSAWCDPSKSLVRQGERVAQ